MFSFEHFLCDFSKKNYDVLSLRFLLNFKSLLKSPQKDDINVFLEAAPSPKVRIIFTAVTLNRTSLSMSTISYALFILSYTN